MWKWLRAKPPYRNDDFKGLAEQLINSRALAVALAETVRDYVDAVKAGKISYPAHRRKGASVVEIWSDLRVEALHKLFNFGQSDPFLLSDHKVQAGLLTSFLDDHAHLEMPQPRGAVVPDTIQAMWQVYLYLSTAGSEVVDRETDRESLKLKGRSILDRIETDCIEVRPKWAAFRKGEVGSKVPPTIVELLYADVTAKAKSIALSTVFGPHYESGISYLESLVAENDAELAAFKAKTKQIINATDPDHL